MSRYDRTIKPGVSVDVYDVLKAFNVTCPATAHAIKKLLAPGQRGAKSLVTDLEEAAASIQRALQLNAPESGEPLEIPDFLRRQDSTVDRRGASHLRNYDTGERRRLTDS